MAGVSMSLKPQAELVLGGAPVMESSGDSNIDGTCGNLSDDGSGMHFSANWSVPASGLNAVIPTTTKFTVLYNGSICVYDGIPAEKVHEILLIAAAAAKSFEFKSGTSFAPLIPTSPSSPQAGTSKNLASQQSVCFPAEKSSICRLQEFPIARRQSLQRFLEKRRDRLSGKAPYASSKTKAVDNTPGSVSRQSQEGFQPGIFAS